MYDKSWNQCSNCGKFISYDDFAYGKAKRTLMFPSSYYTEEEFENTCEKCLKEEQNTMLTTEDHKNINLIMDSFDFERVQKAMIATGWKWANRKEDGKLMFPSLFDIKQSARSLLESSKTVSGISSGGFHAEYFEKFGTFSLSFVLDKQDSHSIAISNG